QDTAVDLQAAVRIVGQQRMISASPCRAPWARGGGKYLFPVDAERGVERAVGIAAGERGLGDAGGVGGTDQDTGAVGIHEDLVGAVVGAAKADDADAVAGEGGVELAGGSESHDAEAAAGGLSADDDIAAGLEG